MTSQEEFWASLKDYFGVQMSGVGPVLATREMPLAEWFPGRRLNYVDTVLSHATSSRPAIIDDSEPGGPGPRTVSWTELARQVSALSSWLRDRGVGEGDCVVGYLPNVAEAVIAFLATASVGATWSCCELAVAGRVTERGGCVPVSGSVDLCPGNLALLPLS